MTDNGLARIRTIARQPSCARLLLQEEMPAWRSVSRRASGPTPLILGLMPGTG